MDHEWVRETPKIEYKLAAFGWDGDSLQEIAMGREEFIDLKARLADRRGIPMEGVR